MKKNNQNNNTIRIILIIGLLLFVLCIFVWIITTIVPYTNKEITSNSECTNITQNVNKYLFNPNNVEDYRQKLSIWQQDQFLQDLCIKLKKQEEVKK